MGIVFRRTDLKGFEIEAQRRWVSRVLLATTLMKKGVMLSTVEHLLSAVYGLGIDNLYVDIDSLEFPFWMAPPDLLWKCCGGRGFAASKRTGVT